MPKFELPEKGKRTAIWLLSLTPENIAALTGADKAIIRKEAQEYIARYANIIQNTVYDNDAVQKLRNDRNTLIELAKKLIK